MNLCDEGMAHEHMMATIIYVSRRDESINGGSLRFKRAFSDAEGQYFREGMDYAQGAGHKRPVGKFFDEGIFQSFFYYLHCML